MPAQSAAPRPCSQHFTFLVILEIKDMCTNWLHGSARGNGQFSRRFAQRDGFLNARQVRMIGNANGVLRLPKEKPFAPPRVLVPIAGVQMGRRHGFRHIYLPVILVLRVRNLGQSVRQSEGISKAPMLTVVAVDVVQVSRESVGTIFPFASRQKRPTLSCASASPLISKRLRPTT